MAAQPSFRRPRPLPHSKRFSAARLSTDTSNSLPAYSSPTSRPPSSTHWSHSRTSSLLDDQPPDYPHSSAEDADKEDDFGPLPGPRSIASKRRSRHRRGDSAHLPTSPSVDDLLERSVVALELSTNALLQSIRTQASISAMTKDEPLEHSIDLQRSLLDVRSRSNRDTRSNGMDVPGPVYKGVHDFQPDGDNSEHGVSRSLPIANSHLRFHRPDGNSRLSRSKTNSPYLHLSTSELDLRNSLRPPRALTQYVSIESTHGDACEATADADSIFLPSTMGQRSASQIQSFTADAAQSHTLRQSASWDSNPPLSPSAYKMLSHLASRHSPARTTSPSVTLHSPSNSDITSRRTTRRHSASSAESSFAFTGGLRRSRSNSRGRSPTSTETPPLPVRAMTPPMEEATPSSSSSTSSLNAFRTMQSLRKILNDASPDPKGKGPEVLKPARKQFQPRSPAVTPSSGTSTATASVSRLFTRSSHHPSQHARQSSLKKTSTTPSASVTPSTTPSTPRNVSFAEPPDAHLRESRPGGKRGKGKRKGKDKDKEEMRPGWWWRSWLPDVSGSAAGTAVTRNEERMEDRMLRGWGRPAFGGGGAEEWMI